MPSSGQSSGKFPALKSRVRHSEANIKGGTQVLHSLTSHAAPDHLLEELIRRQTFTLEKLQRDGAYACEIRAAKRMLRCFEAKLQTRRASGVPLHRTGQ
jgi:hypothetical protein